jgi:glutamate dehydrogenase
MIYTQLENMLVIQLKIMIEQFSNGVTIFNFYLAQIPRSQAPPIEVSIFQIIKEASLIYCLPTTPLQSFFQVGKLSGKKFYT